MNYGTTTAAVSSARVGPRAGLRQRPMVLVVLAVVIVLDQAAKWWAWRHVPGTLINDGGDPLVGATVGRWYADPVRGALLDLLGFGLLGTAVSVLVRHRLPAKVLVPATLMIGGWSSNLLDRLGMHYWTAPGSVRGAVDFIHVGRDHYNVADFFIISATLLFPLGISCLGRRAENSPATVGSMASTTYRQPRRRARMSLFAGAVGLVVVVGMGAANHGGMTTPLATAGVADQ
jgi:lipoprotein signal peptidase